MKPWAQSLSIAAVWLAVAAALGWYFAPSVESPDQLSLASRDTWQLPGIPARRLEAERVTMAATAPYWGTPATASAAPPAAPVRAVTWRLAGVAGQGAARKVLVVYSPESGKPTALLKVGDKLPTDHVISQINEKSICVLIGKKSYELALESTEAGP